MIQNNADKSGRARISQRRRTFRSPGRALVVGHVMTGASTATTEQPTFTSVLCSQQSTVAGKHLKLQQKHEALEDPNGPKATDVIKQTV